MQDSIYDEIFRNLSVKFGMPSESNNVNFTYLKEF